MQKINLRYGRAHLVAKDIEECRNSLEGLIIAPYGCQLGLFIIKNIFLRVPENRQRNEHITY